ncbi:MAG: TIGR04282 family arsenosugar biosynthesis glycosyltransferase [Planctomycetota bacterium]
MSGGRDALVVLAKEPRPGVSKTRLAAEVGEEAAALLARALVEDTLDLARAAPADARIVTYAPADAGPWFERARSWAAVVPQPEGGLGDRMRAAARAAFEDGAGRVVLIGTDAPHVPPTRIREAFDALDEVDVCLGPATDGGYYLIGLAADRSAPFEDVPWSTDEVLQVTRQRCRAAGLSVAELAAETDLDDLAAVREVAAALARGAGEAPRTAAAMRSTAWRPLLEGSA